MEYSGLHNKPKAAVHPGHKWTGPKEEEEASISAFTLSFNPLAPELNAHTDARTLI
jgi:hypothetical protein